MASIRHYKEFTKAQQEVYEGLNEPARNYIEFRRQGMSKPDAYRNAFHYVGGNARQNAYNLEKRSPEITDLVEVLEQAKMVSELNSAKKGELRELIDAKAKQQDVQQVLEAIDDMDGETARRVQFYQDIINGKIRSKKVTIKKDAKDKIIYKQEVVSDDVAVRMQAREKLDRILGLNKVIALDQIECGPITINIVEASKKQEIADKKDLDFIDVDEKDIEVEEDE